MSFRGRTRGLARLKPVNRIKHVVDKQAGVVLNNVENTNLINTVDNPVLANTADVATGSTVNGLYLKVECYATTAGALANVYMIIGKVPGGNIAFPNPNVVGASDNKRYIFHQEMVMMERSVNGNPRTLFNGVIVIPKIYRRNAPNDLTTLAVFAPGVNIDLCIQCHYKEFR